MKKLILGAILICSISIAFTACKSEKKAKEKEEKEVVVEKQEMAAKDVYQCPMDCEKGKTYEKEGKCPVCKMKLKKKAKKKQEDKNNEHGHAH